MDFLESVAQYAAALVPSMAEWATKTYNEVANLSDDVADRSIKLAQDAGGFASATLDRYSTIFQPEEKQQAEYAQRFASDAYKADRVGAAEADVLMGAEKGKVNAQQHLQDFGVSVNDPSSGRYQDLEAANETVAGAQAAAAGVQARQKAEDQQHQLLGESIKTGQALPGQALQAMQTGVGALNTAANSGKIKTDAAAQLSKMPGEYLSIADDLKLPPLGTGPTDSSNVSTSTQTDASKDSSGSGDKDGSGKDGSGKNGSGGGGSGGGGGGNGGAVSGDNPYYTGEDNPIGQPGGETDGSLNDQGLSWGASLGAGGVYDDNGYNSPGWDTGNFDESGPNAYLDQSNVYQGGDYYRQGGFDLGDTDQWTGSAEVSDAGGGDGGGEGYALGGPIEGQQGGMIPVSASPSGGAVQDDVQINAQPNEFVIPRDVAMWKGQEFFQKMIAQSRAARTGAPAHGTKRRGR